MGKRIGVLLVTIDRYYQTDYWKGIQAFGKKHDMTFLFFCGSPYEAPQNDVSHSNAIYNLINANDLDGLIIASSTLGNYIGKERMYKYISRYKDIPAISNAFDYPGMYVVKNDNKKAMKNLLDHLIEVHQYTEIAMISGPRTNCDAKERLEGYKESLEEHGMEYEPIKVVTGQFNQNSAYDAIFELYEENHQTPQVIVCANDDMAIGAFNALSHMGIEVGKDVFLTGYDDIDAVKSFNPPFTTIAQPWFEIGYQSASILKDVLDGKEMDHITVIPGDVIIRESCGCTDILPFELKPEVLQILNQSTKGEMVKEDFEHWLLHHTKTFIKLIDSEIESTNKAFSYRKLLDLVVAFRQDVNEETSEGAFLTCFDKIIHEAVMRNVDVSSWKNAIYAANKYIRRSPLTKELLLIVDEMFYLANTMLANHIERREAFENYRMREVFYGSSILISAFHVVMSTEEMIEMIRKWTHKSDIDLLCINLFDEPIQAVENGQFDYPDKISAVYAYHYKKDYYNVSFKTEEMMPQEIFNDYENDLVFFPIHFKGRHFGYIITNPSSAELLIFRTLREQIGTTLDRIYIYAKLDDYNRELKRISVIDGLTGLYNQRGFYDSGKNACINSSVDNTEMAVIYGDMDGLKQINDRYGHHEGDYAIAFMGETMRTAMDSDDFTGRVGGDEFVTIIIGHETRAKAEAFITRVNEMISGENQSNNKPYKLAISFGYKIFSSSAQLSFEERIMAADKEMYHMKKKRRNGILSEKS